MGFTFAVTGVGGDEDVFDFEAGVEGEEGAGGGLSAGEEF